MKARDSLELGNTQRSQISAEMSQVKLPSPSSEGYHPTSYEARTTKLLYSSYRSIVNFQELHDNIQTRKIKMNSM
jgi:hypothetical protein